MPGLDPREAVRAIARDAAAGVPAGVISARFHRGLARALVDAAAAAAGDAGVDLVALGGGVFQNRLLLEAVAHGGARAGCGC